MRGQSSSGYQALTGVLVDAGAHMHVAELLIQFAAQPRFALSLHDVFRDAGWEAAQLDDVKAQRTDLVALLTNADFLGVMRKLNADPAAAVTEQEQGLLGHYVRICQAINRIQLTQTGAAADADALHDGLPATYYSEAQVQLALGDALTPVGHIGDKRFVIIPPCRWGCTGG